MFLRLLFVFVLFLPSPLLARERLVVFAAASQTDAMNKIEDVFEKRCNCDVVFSFAASSVLARQVDAGANADVFISASADWISWLEERDSILSKTSFIGNRLVIVSSSSDVTPSTLSQGRFSMADPRSVPAGVYAQEALNALALWDNVKQNAVFTENVRIALKLVMRGDLDAGIVYQSDIQALSGGVNISQYLFPKDSHSEIEYVVGKLNGKPTAKDFADFLKSEEAQMIFQRLGFVPLSANKAE